MIREINPVKCWRAIEVRVPAGFEEAVSNFLMEQGATGTEEAEEKGSKRLKAYFVQGSKNERILHALHRYLRSVQRIFPTQFHYQVKSLTLLNKDWSETWKRFFKPIKVTSRIVVKPPWCSIHLKKGQIAIEITPGLAFGTGTHPSTQLCIWVLEKRLSLKGLSLLDVGTGSGILAIIAAKLGAAEVWGIDTDDLSVGIARENVERNNCSRMVRIRLGRVGGVRKVFDVVVANIDFRVLKTMRWPLLRRIKPGGYLVLSGFLLGEQRVLRERYLDTGKFRHIEIRRQGEWACLTLQKERK